MRRTIAATLAAAAVLALGACSTGATGSPAAAPATTAAPVTAAYSLVAGQSPELGTIVADAEGFTLYRFDADTADPPTSTCVDGCAEKWPPFVVDPTGQLTLEGVDQGSVGMVQRPDGTSQLTIGGWPVYRFAADTAPGATAGQGVGGTWFAVTPDGKKAG